MHHDDVLSKLKDIHWAPVISWWPLAPGYYVIVFLLVLLLAMSCFIFWYKKTHRLKKIAMAELLSIEAAFDQDQDVKKAQALIASLIRRLIFSRFKDIKKDQDLASLMPYIMQIFNNAKDAEKLVMMLEDRFQKESVVDIKALFDCAKRQVKRCRV